MTNNLFRLVANGFMDQLGNMLHRARLFNRKSHPHDQEKENENCYDHQLERKCVIDGRLRLSVNPTRFRMAAKRPPKR